MYKQLLKAKEIIAEEYVRAAKLNKFDLALKLRQMTMELDIILEVTGYE